jgi:hypothetical protein
LHPNGPSHPLLDQPKQSLAFDPLLRLVCLGRCRLPLGSILRLMISGGDGDTTNATENIDGVDGDGPVGAPRRSCRQCFISSTRSRPYKPFGSVHAGHLIHRKLPRLHVCFFLQPMTMHIGPVCVAQRIIEAFDAREWVWEPTCCQILECGWVHGKVSKVERTLDAFAHRMIGDRVNLQ